MTTGRPIRFVLHLETARECSGVISSVEPSGQLQVRPAEGRGGTWWVWPDDVTCAGAVPDQKGRRK